jgi:hypothetical protein
VGVSKVTISKVMMAYMNHGKTSAKRKSGRIATITKRNCHILRRILKNHTNTAAEVTDSRSEYSS